MFRLKLELHHWFNSYMLCYGRLSHRWEHLLSSSSSSSSSLYLHLCSLIVLTEWIIFSQLLNSIIILLSCIHSHPLNLSLCLCIVSLVCQLSICLKFWFPILNVNAEALLTLASYLRGSGFQSWTRENFCSFLGCLQVHARVVHQYRVIQEETFRNLLLSN